MMTIAYDNCLLSVIFTLMLLLWFLIVDPLNILYQNSIWYLKAFFEVHACVILTFIIIIIVTV